MTNAAGDNNTLTKIPDIKERKWEEEPYDDIQSIIMDKINSVGFLRGIRIALSKRLHRYSNQWKFLMFFMNVEAVIIVLLSLTNTIETIDFGQFSISFDLFSGVFTLYVILLQYFVNTLNYKERTLRVHYHELELEDLLQEFQMLLLHLHMKAADMSEKEVVDKYYKLVDQYQLALKNNENHRAIDFESTVYDTDVKRYKRGKIDKMPRLPKDRTLDMALIYINTLLPVVILFVIGYAFIF